MKARTTLPRAITSVFLLLALPVAAPRLHAQAREAQQLLPTPGEVLDRYVAALGGEEAVRRHRHVSWKGKLEMPGMGIEGEARLRASAPDLFRLELESEALGLITQGYDGRVAWVDNPMTGPMVLEGAELEATTIQSDFYADLDYRENYSSIDVMAEQELDGEAAYKLALTTPGGQEAFHYFSVETGLLIGMEGEQPTPMGDVWVVTRIGGYKEFDGRLYPTVSRQDVMGAQQILTLSEPDFGEIDPGVYELPEPIKALVAASAAEAP